MQLTIRPMQQNDLDAVAAIERASIPQPWSREGFESELSSRFAVCLVATLNDLVVGFLCAQNVLGTCCINAIATALPHRRHGIGNRLIKQYLDYCKQTDCQSINLEVRSQNKPAIQFYEALGFTCIGRRTNFYSNPKDDALLYALIL